MKWKKKHLTVTSSYLAIHKTCNNFLNIYRLTQTKHLHGEISDPNGRYDVYTKLKEENEEEHKEIERAVTPGWGKEIEIKVSAEPYEIFHVRSERALDSPIYSRLVM